MNKAYIVETSEQ